MRVSLCAACGREQIRTAFSPDAVRADQRRSAPEQRHRPHNPVREHVPPLVLSILPFLVSLFPHSFLSRRVQPAHCHEQHIRVLFGRKARERVLVCRRKVTLVQIHADAGHEAEGRPFLRVRRRRREGQVQRRKSCTGGRPQIVDCALRGWPAEEVVFVVNVREQAGGRDDEERVVKFFGRRLRSVGGGAGRQADENVARKPAGCTEAGLAVRSAVGKKARGRTSLRRPLESWPARRILCKGLDVLSRLEAVACSGWTSGLSMRNRLAEEEASQTCR